MSRKQISGSKKMIHTFGGGRFAGAIGSPDTNPRSINIAMPLEEASLLALGINLCVANLNYGNPSRRKSINLAVNLDTRMVSVEGRAIGDNSGEAPVQVRHIKKHAAARTTKEKGLFTCKIRDADAVMQHVSEHGFVVLKGSRAQVSSSPDRSNTRKRIRAMRNRLIAEGTMEDRGDHCVFTRHHLFTAPSTAAEAVLARSSNGWTDWKAADGHDLGSVMQR